MIDGKKVSYKKYISEGGNEDCAKALLRVYPKQAEKSSDATGGKMEERRKSKRTEMESKLIIKRLDGQSNKEVVIYIADVSKSGVGFECEEVLNIGEVYEAYLTIWTKEVIHSFLQIVRIELSSGGYSYGAVFVGMPEMDSNRIEVYQSFNE